jgi:hypothetical protein
MNNNRDLGNNEFPFVGIDKLALTIKHLDFQVDRLNFANGWTVYRPESPKCPILMPLLQETDGNIVLGSNAHANLKGIAFDIDHRGLRVMFNPSKLAGHEWHLSGPEILPIVKEQIMEASDMLTLDFDWTRANIARIDIPVQNEMEEPPEAYVPILRELKGLRASTALYETGITIIGSKEQTAMYWKREELMEKSKKDFDCPESMLRIEPRFSDNKKVCKRLELNTWPELLTKDQTDLRKAYSDYLRAMIFRTDPDVQLRLPYPEIDQIFDYCRLKFGRQKGLVFFEDALNVDGATHIDHFGGIGGYMKYLSRKGYTRQHLRKKAKDYEVRQHLRHEVLRILKGKGSTNIALLQEIKSKFL